MANYLSGARAAGVHKGKYKGDLIKGYSAWDELSLIDKSLAYDTSKLNRRMKNLSSVIKLTSTIAGGYEAKQKHKKHLELVSKKLEKDEGLELVVPEKQSFFDRTKDFMMGKETMYTFEGEDYSKVFSKTGIDVKGGKLLGESMLDELEDAPKIFKGNYEEKIITGEKSGPLTAETHKKMIKKASKHANRAKEKFDDTLEIDWDDPNVWDKQGMELNNTSNKIKKSKKTYISPYSHGDKKA